MADDTKTAEEKAAADKAAAEEKAAVEARTLPDGGATSTETREIQHFDGSVDKVLEDGTHVMSSYVDYDNGERLASEVAAEEQAKADEDAAKAAEKAPAAKSAPAPATTPAASSAPAPAAQK